MIIYFYHPLQIKFLKFASGGKEFLFSPPADCVMDVRWCMLDSGWDFRLVAQKADDLAAHIPSIRLFVAPAFCAHVFLKTRRGEKAIAVFLPTRYVIMKLENAHSSWMMR